jgi:hypothetical protein
MYKTTYRVRNWAAYDRVLVRRGDVTVWLSPEAIDATVDDATTGIDPMEAVDGDVASLTADAAYDTVAIYDAASAQGANVVVPPAKTAKVSRRRPRSSARRGRATSPSTRPGGCGECRQRSPTVRRTSAKYRSASVRRFGRDDRTQVTLVGQQ